VREGCRPSGDVSKAEVAAPRSRVYQSRTSSNVTKAIIEDSLARQDADLSVDLLSRSRPSVNDRRRYRLAPYGGLQPLWHAILF
jgi:hypothetical protein